MEEKKNLIEDIDSGITTTHGSVPWSGRKLAGTVKGPDKPRDYCPVMGTHCGKGCAAYNNGACVLLTGGTMNTAGLCPVNRNSCKPDTCVMCQDGTCRLFQRGVNNE